MILVTSYVNPDLDGVACSIAYAELLRAQGKEAEAAIFGEIQTDALYPLEQSRVPKPANAETLIDQGERIIIVDSSMPKDLSPLIKLEKVTEIIDHHLVHEAEKFVNAKVQIDLVASCATLITERFHEEEISPSRPIALLLASAIIADSMNGKALITTERDLRMRTWLEQIVNVSPAYIHEMFLARSKFLKPLKQVIIDDYTDMTLGGKAVGILQLAVTNLERLISVERSSIEESIEEMRAAKKLDYVFWNGIDIELGYNLLLATDIATRKLLSRILGVQFTNNVMKIDRIRMRKEFWALIRNELEKS